MATRPSGRAADALRDVKLETGVNRYAEGSCLVSFGHTRVLVTASLDETVPGFLRGRRGGAGHGRPRRAGPRLPGGPGRGLGPRGVRHAPPAPPPPRPPRGR